MRLSRISSLSSKGWVAPSLVLLALVVLVLCGIIAYKAAAVLRATAADLPSANVIHAAKVPEAGVGGAAITSATSVPTSVPTSAPAAAIQA